jgi:RNA polymerase sigma-70 factor (ECF subfamily)
MNTEPAIAARGPEVDFGRTRWSMVAAVRDSTSPQARRSLVELCRRYWVPAYVYLRRSGEPPAHAASLAQEFLSGLVTQLRSDELCLTAGFRAYMQTRLEDFLARRAHDAAPRSEPLPEMKPPWPLEKIEQRQSEEHPPDATPAQALQRAFALEMLALALARLEREAEQSGRAGLFEAVRMYLSSEPTAEDYAALARQMKTSTLACVIAVKRLRQRFQELIDEELAETLGDSQALATERHTLLSLVMPPVTE